MSGDKYELKPGRGGLFLANDDRKEDYSGSIKVQRDVAAGEIIKVYGYKQTSQNGKSYVSLMVLDKKEDEI